MESLIYSYFPRLQRGKYLKIKDSEEGSSI